MILEKCCSCPYAKWVSIEDGTEPQLECDPPMGECLAEFPEEGEAKTRHDLTDH